MIVWAIIPVKPLRLSKSRLAHILTTEERAELTGAIFSRALTVLNEVRGIDRILVVSRDQGVLKIARQYNALTYDEGDKQDLNAAVTKAAHVAAAQRVEGVLILPADLPFFTVEDIQMMLDSRAQKGQDINDGVLDFPKGMIAICTDHNRDGTNALLLCPPNGFNFQYGPGSFRLHLEEATRLGMTRQILDAPGIRFDLDTEKDWKTYLTLRQEPGHIVPETAMEK
jgi:2-phospho-L-lactate guanylyltransferase